MIASPQINLHLTDAVSDNTTDIVFQHDRLHVLASTVKRNNIYQIISYCLTELSSKWNIEEKKLDQNLFLTTLQT
ncbi:unnamed protein product [Rotaria sp. Silwood1]|nr:unnamed protein product [Rotaria sp. Silwood1]CAF4999733.1 unnamed protein product [Rotaria sp. Silwood1]